MNATSRRIACVASLVLLGGCVVYDPYYHPYTQPGVSTAQMYDRAWDASMGAMQDQGVNVTTADRPTGVIEGRRGAMIVRSTLVTQADGRVRVEINVRGELGQDP